ncbi:MAG: DUF4423 domain-containing protein [Bdellovibrionales bacterium]
MIKELYQFKTYFEYLRARLNGKAARGFKARLASAISVQPAYISLVLKEKAHLSLEQAEATNSFFNHDSQESHYFLLLVQRERSGTKNLRQYFQRQLDEILKTRLLVKERLSMKNQIREEDQDWYYSSWIPAALHMAITIPRLNQPKNLARALHLPLNQVIADLERLEQMGLIRKTGLHYQPSVGQIHLGRSSTHLLKHHTNWRLQALQNLPFEDNTELHYSAVVTLSEDDILRVKDRLLDAIKSCVDIIKDSKEEKLYGLSLDFFNVLKREDPNS